MAYFFVLPAFVLWLVVAALAVLVAKTAPRLAPIYPYIWRVSVWATVGFLIANIALVTAVALGFGAVEGSSSDSTAVRDTVQLTIGVAAIVGPFVASVVGWLAGAVVGLAFAYRSFRHA